MTYYKKDQQAGKKQEKNITKDWKGRREKREETI